MKRLEEPAVSVKSIPVRKRRLRQVPPNRPHCRVCSLVISNPSIYHSPNMQIIQHLERKHPESALDVFSELDILFGMAKGDHSRCSHEKGIAR